MSTRPARRASTMCRRMETSIEALESIADSNARGLARNLLESALDLHAIALAKVLTICQEAENGELLIRNLLADPYVGAVVLLHGLTRRTPRPPAEQLARCGRIGRPRFRVELAHIDQTAARVRVTVSATAGHEANKTLALEIEQVLTDAAPDLDRIVVEVSENRFRRSRSSVELFEGPCK